MYYRSDKAGVILYVKVKPNSTRDAIMGVEQGAVAPGQPLQAYLVIQIQAPKHEGQANKRLIAFLAKLLSIAKNRVVLCNGVKSHYKQIKLLAIETQILTEAVDKYIIT